MTTIQTLRRLIDRRSVARWRPTGEAEMRHATPLCVICIAAVVAGALAISTPAASAATTPSPIWHLSYGSRPTNLQPGSEARVVLTAANLGTASADGETLPITLTDSLPPGLLAKSITAVAGKEGHAGPVTCSKLPLPTCTFTKPLVPFDLIEVRIVVEVKQDASSGELNEFSVVGGGASASSTEPITVSSETTPFGLQQFELSPESASGSTATQAGSHPFQLTTDLLLNQLATKSNSEAAPVALAKDVGVKLPPGLVGNPLALPRCTLGQFLTRVSGQIEAINACPPQTAVGVAIVGVYEPAFLRTITTVTVPIFDLEPSFGEPARFGFFVPPANTPVLIDTSLRSGEGEDYGITASTTNINQSAALFSSVLTFWGVPGDSAHDSARGWSCIMGARGPWNGSPCASTQEQARPAALLTLPTSCSGAPVPTAALIDSWSDPGAFLSVAGTPMAAFDGCNRDPFSPDIKSQPTSNAATSPTGLSFDIDFEDEGLTNAQGIAESDLKKAVVTLPQGFTTNPSVAEGLKACSLAEYEAATTALGSGCTDESKIGDVEIESPLVTQTVHGSLYVAQQTQNPNHNLLTIYMVARNEELGVIIKQALKVTPDPVTGQLTTEVDNVPQLPFSRFHLSFRQGQRSPLITPPGCGAYTVKALMYPYSAPDFPVERDSSFEITQGPEGLPCPSGGTPPFHPNLEAGTQNNAAGSYSPFYTRISRKDSEQEITHFSIKLPPGVVGKLAGVAQCSNAQIAAAKAREHEGGGQEELASPSCPASSEVGHTLVGTGVGNVLAYAPGKLYLAGPYHGAPISIVAITAAKVGPFDLGTVVVREALRVNPETAEVSVDATGSDPIPHIVDGIPTHLRDIRIYVNRPEFVLNPTGCERTSTASTVLGSGLDFVSEADDNPVTVSSPFQAADCAALGFKPKISFQLKGGTKRAQIPALKATVTARPGDANIGRAEVILPSSEILEQGHIGTSCTRVQFKEGAGNGAGCPANSIYGRARAVTPILSEPLEGPVYLRSNGGERALPDLVAALRGQEINIDLVGFIDSVREKGKDGEVTSRLRTRFENVPDAPVSKFTLEMLGGKKGLLINRTNLCLRTHRAEVNLTAHSGKIDDFRPVVKTSCPKRKHGKGKKHGKRSRSS